MTGSKLADWDDDDPQAIRDTSSRWDKVVILKHLFTLQELEVGTLLVQKLHMYRFYSSKFLSALCP